ncbi:hypothetical protein BCY86_06395 [Pajaroellobacter abortibovis]|uniref:Uncharacterized protein n=1 Tax=Pajaroellobacter abortibovis TaxID=1882918 RepID=A0A1L6MY62_9BACT|nr:hypothetical protein BCY86_06395 [Pajaroellobacter abortibovis]
MQIGVMILLGGVLVGCKIASIQLLTLPSRPNLTRRQEWFVKPSTTSDRRDFLSIRQIGEILSLESFPSRPLEMLRK